MSSEKRKAEGAEVAPGKRARASAAAYSSGNAASVSVASVAATSAAAAAATSSFFPADVDNRLRALQRSTQRSFASSQLATLLLAKDRSLKDKWTAVREAFDKDAAAPAEPLLSLSQIIEGKGPLLMLLIDAIADDLLLQSYIPDELNLPRKEAWNLFQSAIPHVGKLISSSFDPSLTRNGCNALHVLTYSTFPNLAGDWVYNFAEALLYRGCDVNARDPSGNTPLLEWCSDHVRNMDSCGPLLLLKHGADIDARGSDGYTAAHYLAELGHRAVLLGLADGGWLLTADLTLLSNAGESALQVAQRKLTEQPEDSSRREIVELLREQAALWQSQARPLLHSLLSHSLLLPDLADIVLSYIDGQKRSG